MDHKQRRRIARTSLSLPILGFGGATLGDAAGAIPDAQAQAALEAAYAAGIAHFDTAPWYGNGKSELRVGQMLRSKPRNSFALTTKVGRVYSRCVDPEHASQQRWRGGLPFSPVFDYSAAGIARSYEQSLLRLGLGSVDALVIHDIDEGHQGSAEQVACRLDELGQGGGFAALTALKQSGEIAAIGAGVNRIGMIPKFLARFAIDFFVVAMPYTLLDQAALDKELALCTARGVSVVIGAPFASGILASGPLADASYGYRQAPADMLEKARAILRICERHDVPLGAAALQFPLAHPAVVSVIPGPNHADQVRSNLAWMAQAIPDALWTDLRAAGLIRADAPVPSGGP